ncbi:flagellar biosynthesis regulator FlaF [uncultured Alsobacter sp.]|uniref:flagellar biosynthesis regulator FlaF n=1 Tax=uncultured Alsobacter sp. TaxID=1748258 RepID=UPI0025E0DE84|nr:flagellar biosynthesis regulator FlaF [uncultured Alsobacter sp.]
MNAKAQQTYATAARAGLTGRALEAALFNQIAVEIERCVSDDRVDIDALQRAVDRNRTFWALVGGDAAAPESSLPGDLKRDLQGLCAWTMKQSVRALVDPRPPQVLPLARINRILAEGLSARPDPVGPAGAPSPLRGPVAA